MNRENGHNTSRGRSSADRDGKSIVKRERIRISDGNKKPLFSSNRNRSTSNYERRESGENTYSNRFNGQQGDNRNSYSNREGGERGGYRASNNRYQDNRGGGDRYQDRDNNRYQDNRGGGERYQDRGNNRFQDNRGGNDRYQDRNNQQQDRNERSQGGYNQSYGEGGNNRFQNRDRNFSGNRPQGGFRPRSNDYDPNAKYSHKKQMEYKRKDIDPTKPVRLNKFLANAGICSRREADEYIQAGVITVNGEIITEMGAKVLLGDKVMFHDQPIRSERKVYILLNKPKNCVTTTEDTHERTTVMDLVKNACSERVYPVGRLDRNTTGVLLLTNDGDLAARLTHPKHHKKKIYHATLDKPLEKEDYETIMAGIQLDEETIIKPDALEYIKEDDNKQLGIEIHSGQNRVVRRIFEKVGYKVIRLDRVFFAGLTKKNLQRGKYRLLNQREINMLLMGAFE